MNINSENILKGGIVFLISFVALWGVWTIITRPAASQEAIDFDISADDNVKGESDVLITIVEYSDFQCPACAYFAPIINKLVTNNPDTVRLVFRHYPLSQHKASRLAAYAAEAAGKQEKFFEYHDLLYKNQNSWGNAEDIEETLLSYAEELELDIKQFKADMTSDEIQQEIENDLASGKVSGVDATPSFYLNGERIRNPSSINEFQKLIDTKLKELGAVVEKANTENKAQN